MNFFFSFLQVLHLRTLCFFICFSSLVVFSYSAVSFAFPNNSSHSGTPFYPFMFTHITNKHRIKFTQEHILRIVFIIWFSSEHVYFASCEPWTRRSLLHWEPLRDYGHLRFTMGILLAVNIFPLCIQSVALRNIRIRTSSGANTPNGKSH